MTRINTHTQDPITHNTPPHTHTHKRRLRCVPFSLTQKVKEWPVPFFFIPLSTSVRLSDPSSDALLFIIFFFSQRRCHPSAAAATASLRSVSCQCHITEFLSRHFFLFCFGSWSTTKQGEEGIPLSISPSETLHDSISPVSVCQAAGAAAIACVFETNSTKCVFK